MASLESINTVEEFLINEKSYFIKLVEELESRLPINVYFEDDESSASSSYSDLNDEPTHEPLIAF